MTILLRHTGVLQRVDVLTANYRYPPTITSSDTKYPNDKMKEVVADKQIPRCPECDGLVKPDIVFFGEALPERFFTRRVDMHSTGVFYESRV